MGFEDVKMHIEIEKQFRMKKRPAALVGYYNEAVSQMSLIVYYACVFPFAPLFSVITNIIDFDIKLRSLGTYDRRQWSEIASGIGDWSRVMELISFVAIPLNFAVLYFTRVPPGDATDEFSNSSKTVQWLLLKEFSTSDCILLIIMVEHILIIIKTLLQGVIPDVEPSVLNKEAQRAIQAE